MHGLLFTNLPWCVNKSPKVWAAWVLSDDAKLTNWWFQFIFCGHVWEVLLLQFCAMFEILRHFLFLSVLCRWNVSWFYFVFILLVLNILLCLLDIWVYSIKYLLILLHIFYQLLIFLVIVVAAKDAKIFWLHMLYIFSPSLWITFLFHLWCLLVKKCFVSLFVLCFLYFA